MGAGRRRQPRVELGEAAARPHGGERGGQAALGRRGVVGVGGGDAADAVAGGELGEGVVARRVERVAVVPQLDEHPVAAERLDQPVQLAAGSGRAVGHERRRHCALAAAGQHPHVPGGVAGDVGERELRRPLLPRQVAEAQRAGQAGVPVGPVGEQQEVVAVGVGGVAVGDPPGGDLGQRVAPRARHPLVRGQARRQRDLGAEHGRHPDRAGGLGEADDAVEAVVVGEGEGLEAEAGGLGGQLLGVRGAVEEREVGVAVQLGVGHRAPCRSAGARRGAMKGWRCGSTPARHHRRSTTGCPAPGRPVPPRPRAPPPARSTSTTGC